MVEESPSTVSPSVEIIEAVADETGIDPMELPRLHRFIDTDALDSLLTKHLKADANGDVIELEFNYADTAVSVRCDGELEVEVTSTSE